MSGSERESQFLERLISSLEAQGYSVYTQPSAAMLPKFMGSYIPDAVALGKPKNLAIEIRLEGTPKKFDDIQARFRGNDDWEWRVYYIRPADTEPEIESTPVAAFERTIEEVEALIKAGHKRAALLLSWATLEAIARSLLPDKFRRAQSPGRLVEVLASEGYVTPNQADTLRALVSCRNRFIHGALEIDVRVEDLNLFVSIVKSLGDLRLAKLK